MTAEILVANSLGVALAADSAVSIGVEPTKIYASADKLFQLSHSQPIGIMIHANANLLSVPWEAIIKQYRRVLGTGSFAATSAYANDFAAFLAERLNVFAPDAQESFVISSATTLFYTLAVQFAESLGGTSPKIREARAEFERFIGEHLARVVQTDLLTGLSDSVPKLIQKTYEATLEAAARKTLGKLAATKKACRHLAKFFSEAVCRTALGPPSSTGVVIAGFGEDEIFPAMHELEFRGLAANKLLFRTARTLDIGTTTESVVVPFAQDEMVHAFMAGADPDLLTFMAESSFSVMSGVVSAILRAVRNNLSTLADAIEQPIKQSLKDAFDDLGNSWRQRQEDDFWDPILAMVAALPKDELAKMAEALVELTKLKRRVSNQAETVGGPIDVAVITKGDGFIWIKRKHYCEKRTIMSARIG